MEYQQTAWDELCEILGEEHSLNFMKIFGGNRVYLPKISSKEKPSSSPTSSPSVREMLDAAGEIISIRARRMLGGFSVYVPMLEEKNLIARNAKIAEMRHGGARIRDLARAHGLSERSITTILRDAS